MAQTVPATPDTSKEKAEPSSSTAGETGPDKPADTSSGSANAPSANDASLSPSGTEDGEVIGKVPLAEPPPEVAKPAVNQPQSAPVSASANTDELDEPGYLPGYRRYIGLGQSPYAPPVGAMPGGFTPGYAAPSPSKAWTFTFAGSANVSAQYTGMSRRNPGPGQHDFVWHTPPRSIEEWSPFTSSSSVPGHWVSLRFAYGTSKVSANLSIDTWNPVEPTTYFQMGSNSYVNNAYLSFTPEPIGPFRLRTNAGQFVSSYGLLSKYGGGVYVNPLAGTLRGIGETTTVDYDLTEKATLSIEHGLMTTRDASPSINNVTAMETGYRRLYWSGAFIHHAHAALKIAGPYEVTAELHYINNFAHEDRNQWVQDNPQTPQINEASIKDPHVRVYTADVKVEHQAYGLLGLGVTYLQAKHSYPLKGMLTYGGDGEWLTDRWFGAMTTGTGQLFVAAINYGVSLGKLISYPTTFSGNGPDLIVNTGVHFTKTWTDFKPYDGRARWKGALDGMYTFIRYVGFGARIDHIVPNSYDSGETYNVLATRLQFKSDWQSRETLSLIYAKWFYGTRTHNEGTGLRTPDRMDDTLIALNFNMWW